MTVKKQVPSRYGLNDEVVQVTKESQGLLASVSQLALLFVHVLGGTVVLDTPRS